MPALFGSGVAVILAGFALFAAVMLVVMGIDAWVVERRNLARRLMLQGELASSSNDVEPQRVVLEDDLLKRFAKFLTPANVDELASARQRLIRAGYRAPSAVRVYNFAKPVLGLIFAIAALLLASFVAPKLATPVRLVIALLGGTIGFFIPWFQVERRLQRRREEAELAFPDMLDMLLICIEAGSGIDHACRRVAEEVAGVSPVLAEELGVVNAELWAGKERATVFRDFANRLGVNDISAFATVLKQSDEFGVSIAESLRVYAADMRLKRITRAEEKANTMPIKVALGSIFFTVPPTMIIMAGPSLYTLFTVFGGP